MTTPTIYLAGQGHEHATRDDPIDWTAYGFDAGADFVYEADMRAVCPNWSDGLPYIDKGKAVQAFNRAVYRDVPPDKPCWIFDNTWETTDLIGHHPSRISPGFGRLVAELAMQYPDATDAELSLMAEFHMARHAWAFLSWRKAELRRLRPLAKLAAWSIVPIPDHKPETAARDAVAFTLYQPLLNTYDAFGPRCTLNPEADRDPTVRWADSGSDMLYKALDWCYRIADDNTEIVMGWGIHPHGEPLDSTGARRALVPTDMNVRLHRMHAEIHARYRPRKPRMSCHWTHPATDRGYSVDDMRADLAECRRVIEALEMGAKV